MKILSGIEYPFQLDKDERLSVADGFTLLWEKNGFCYRLFEREDGSKVWRAERIWAEISHVLEYKRIGFSATSRHIALENELVEDVLAEARRIEQMEAAQDADLLISEDDIDGYEDAQKVLNCCEDMTSEFGLRLCGLVCEVISHWDDSQDENQ